MRLTDVRLAIRHLTGSLGFTAVVVLTLALGIGASTAIFSVVNAVVLRPLPYPEPNQLVRITSELVGLGAADTGVAAPELFDYQSRTDLFTGVAGVMPVSANVTSGGTPERVEMMLVSWNYFSILGVPALHGRTFGPEDDAPGVANVAVVSHGFWQRRLNADPSAVGRTIVIDEDPILVVGVMPPRFQHPGRTVQSDADVWSPAGFRGAGTVPPSRSRRRLEGAIARLQPGVSLEQAQSRLSDYGQTARQDYATDYPAEHGWTPRALALQDHLVANVATPMFVLLAGVALLLLVACVNVAHLVLARSSARRQEMAVRQALGASRARLTGQLAAESAVLALAGGALGVLMASWGVRALTLLAPGRIPRIGEVGLDVTAVLVAGAISLAVTMIFALVPAFSLRGLDMFPALKAGARGRSTDGSANRTRHLLVGAEVALATVLLVGAGLLVRTVSGLLHVPVGFEAEDLLTARLTLPRPNDTARATYLDAGQRSSFYRDVQRRLSALPGVERAALSSQIPLGGFNPPLFIEIDEDDAAARSRRTVQHFQVSTGYFETMGVRIVRGRSFTDADRQSTEPVAIVSEAAGRTFWPGRDPVGERIRYSPDLPWMTVVGVAADVVNRRLTEPAQPMLYRPLEQSSDLTVAFLLRVRGDAAGIVESMTREVRAADPDVPVYAVRSMADIVAANVAQRQFLMRLLVAFGTLATALALLGIYGVMSYAVAQRTREIGIRMSIGARQSDVARMIITRGLAMTVAGVVVGLAASLFLSRLVESQLFGVRTSDPLTLTTVFVLMTVVAAAAAWIPARRAARVDPVVALRAE
jgi:predicted permease